MKSFVHLGGLLMGLACGVAGCAPGSGTEGREGAATNAPSAAVVMGFESPGAWSVQSGRATLGASTQHLEGAQSLSLSNVATTVTVQSSPIAPPSSVGDSLTVALALPSSLGWGQIQLFVESPSRGIWSQYLGAQGLAGLPTGSFQVFRFSLPAATVSALRAGTAADLVFRVTINAPAAGPYLLDALSFGTPTPPTDDPHAPQGLQGYGKGGADVALLWDGVKTVPVQQYRVYRDGSFIGNAAPRPTGTFFQDSVTYVDTAVVSGSTYNYQVQSVLQDGSLSALSAPVAVAYSNAGVPVPEVIVDASLAPDTLPYLQQAPAIIKTWYPKIGNMLAQPEYLPPSTITVKAVVLDGIKPCTNPGWVSWPATVINVCAGYALDHPNDISLFVHESTHVMQNYVGAFSPRSNTEGMASWAGDLAMKYTQPKPAATSLYTDGYAPMSYFLTWLVTKGYAPPSLVHDLNIAAHADAFSYDLFKQATGRTIGQLWTELSGLTASTEGPLVNGGGKCLDLTLGNTDDGTALRLLDCWRTGYQLVAYLASAPGASSGVLKLEQKCVTAVGNAIQLISCDGRAAQQWRPSADWSRATLTNLATNGCLQPDPTSTSTNPPLVTGSCTDSPSTRWTLLP